MADKVKWHSIPLKEVIKTLKTGPAGLSSEEARRRLERYGFNEIEEVKKESLLKLFFRQFKNVLVVILLAATAISLIIGEIVDAATILAIVVACAALGFTQEYRAEKAVEALRKMTAPTATVIRDGEEKEIPARELVPGDVILLAMGDRVPADARLLEAANLKVNEAPLTGESVPVEKRVCDLPPETPLPERVNMVYSGTTVVYGRGKAVVVETGMKTEFGRIAAIVREAKKEETPLEKRMAEIGKWLGLTCVLVCAVIGVIGVLRGYHILDVFIWSVSLAVAAVPEALPAVVTGALAIGMYKMAKRNAIVKRLPAVETLGCTTVICSDKTGTMTKGEMTVKEIYVDGCLVEVTGTGYEPKGKFLVNGKPVNPLENKGLSLLLTAAALCNDAKLTRENGKWRVVGDPTEGALLVAAEKASLRKRLKGYERVYEIPFTPERKMMTTVYKSPDGDLLVFSKGAPEVILNKCHLIYKEGKVQALTEKEKREVLRVNEEMAGRALRNLALAFKELNGELKRLDESVEENLIFLGLMGMIDPLREEAKKAVKLCRKAGIKVVMVTGDHALTATAIAKQLGMYEEGDVVLSGLDLERIDEEELAGIAERVRVYARVSPEHKVKIVKALKRRGHIVAMTGDGVNDAPALKMADIGVAMGVTGTDVAKEAADMILADDNFATIVEAVRQGREIFENVRKYLAYLLQCNISEILIMAVASFMGLPLPLTAPQILWVNLTTDGLPALALGVDPGDPDIMERPPRKLGESVFSGIRGFLVLVPIIVTIALLATFAFSLKLEGLLRARTQLFTAMVLTELAIAVSCRSLRHPVFRVNPFANRFLWLAIAASLAMQLAVLYTPQLHAAFDVTFPTTLDWIIALVVALAVFSFIEMLKFLTQLLRRFKVNIPLSRPSLK